MTSPANTPPSFLWRFKRFKAMYKAILLLTLMLLLKVANGQVSPLSLLTNGDFESGNGVGFSSFYTYLPAATGNTNAGQYGVGTNPQPYNTASFSNMGDHTSGAGNMMIVDGTNNGGNPDPFFWRVNNNGEICGLVVGASYTFSYWVRSIYNTGIAGATPADIRIKWNNVQGQGGNGWSLAPTTGSTIAPAPGAAWTQVSYTVVPTNACIRIEMFDLNGSLAGNDFALDDVELIPFPPPLQLRHNQGGPSCPGANDGFIGFYGMGGTPPYAFSFNGGPFGANNLFGNLSPGNYTVSVRDATGMVVTSNPFTITDPNNPLVITPSATNICSGQSVTLTASGSQSSYNWTAVPADPSLTAPNQPGINVQPTTSTTYTVSSTYNYSIQYPDQPVWNGIQNLIYNHDFNLGDSGFYSDYTKLLPNTGLLQGAYAVVSDPRDFESTFSSCADYNSVGDKMLVVDGATSAGKKIWCQKVKVQPGKRYGLRYWIRMVAPGNPARITILVNGVKPLNLFPLTAPNPYTILGGVCGTWEQVGNLWDAGTATEAEICLINENLSAAGNDFAIDNFQFGAINPPYTCQFTQNVTVTVAPLAAPVANVTTVPTCATPTGTITVSAPAPAAGIEYRINGGAWQAGNIFSGLSAGNYTIETRQGATCISPGTLLAVPSPPTVATPSASIMQQPTCAAPTGTLAVNSPLGAGFEYRLNSGNYQSSPTFTGLVPGSYTVTVREIATGCTSTGSALVMNAVPAAPATPTATVTVQPTCTSPTGTITITAPLGAGLEYQLNSGAFQTTTTFTGLAPGSYTVTVRNAAGCTTTGSALVVNAVPAAPTTPTATVTVQPTCTTPNGTIMVTAPLGAGLEYQLNSGAFQTATTFTNLAPGSYTVTVRNTAGCTSTGSALVVNAVPAAPATPTATVTAQPDCTIPTGTIVITAPLGAGLEYSVGGAFQSSNTFTGLTNGLTYNVVVRNVATGCISAALPLVVNPIPGAPGPPSASVTSQPTCLLTVGTITVNAPLGAGFSYSIGSGFQASPLFPNLPPGSYNLTVRSNSSGCTSSPSVVVIDPPPTIPTPTVTVVQPTCASPTGSATVSAPTGPNIEYRIDGGPWQLSATFNNLAAGNHFIGARNSSTGCTSTALTITINDSPAVPAAPTVAVSVAPTCTVSTGIFTISSPLGADLEYSISANNWQASPVFTAVAPGNYTIRVRNTSSTCVSAGTTLAMPAVPTAPPAPGASVTQQPTCNNPTGSITISSPSGSSYAYSLDGVTFQAGNNFTNLAPGTYSAVVRENNSGCVSAATAMVIDPLPPPLPAPTAAVTQQPTCAQPTGTIAITSPTGSGWEYSVGAGFQISPIFTGLTNGTNYNVVARNVASGCTSAAAVLSINTIPGAPAAPIAAITTAPTCATPTANVTISSPVGAGWEYSSGGNTFQSSPLFAGLPAGTVANLTVRSTASGCVSAPTQVAIPAVPTEPQPVASVTSQPTCSNPKGNIVVTQPNGVNYQYSLNGGAYQNSNAFPGLAPGNYSLTARNNATGCVSIPLVLTVSAPATAPPPPVIAIVRSPDCNNNTVDFSITQPLGPGLSYSIDGGTTFTSNTSFTNANPGATLNLLTRNTNSGCTSAQVAANLPPAVVVPPPTIAAITTAPSCQSPTATITVSAPLGSQYTYSIGGQFQVSPVFTNVPPGVYSVRTLISSSGCTSNSMALTVSDQPALPPAPVVVSPVGYCQNALAQPLQATGTALLWYTAATGGNGSSTAPTPSTANPGSSTWYVSQTVAGCESPRAPVVVNITAPPVVNAGPNATIDLGGSTTLQGSASGNSLSLLWSPPTGLSSTTILQPIASPQATTTYTLTATSGGCSASDAVTISVRLDIVIPNAFSPNGDGINDVWLIRNLSTYPNAHLLVFDRYGRQVYDGRSGSQPWTGEFGGGPVPAGVYYYILDKGDGSKRLSGSVTVLR